MAAAARRGRVNLCGIPAIGALRDSLVEAHTGVVSFQRVIPTKEEATRVVAEIVGVEWGGWDPRPVDPIGTFILSFPSREALEVMEARGDMRYDGMRFSVERWGSSWRSAGPPTGGSIHWFRLQRVPPQMRSEVAVRRMMQPYGEVKAIGRVDGRGEVLDIGIMVKMRLHTREDMPDEVEAVDESGIHIVGVEEVAAPSRGTTVERGARGLPGARRQRGMQDRAPVVGRWRGEEEELGSVGSNFQAGGPSRWGWGVER